LKRAELLRRIARGAARRGVAVALVRQGGEHEVWQCGGTRVVIPRHREINELTALAIVRRLERELGEGWWGR
jgi:hypothetical protein